MKINVHLLKIFSQLIMSRSQLIMSIFLFSQYFVRWKKCGVNPHCLYRDSLTLRYHHPMLTLLFSHNLQKNNISDYLHYASLVHCYYIDTNQIMLFTFFSSLLLNRRNSLCSLTVLFQHKSLKK